MRRYAKRYNQHLFKIELYAGLTGYGYMPVMYGVEGAPEYSYAFLYGIPPASTALSFNKAFVSISINEFRQIEKIRVEGINIRECGKYIYGEVNDGKQYGKVVFKKKAER
jgi:hypothetical protein